KRVEIKCEHEFKNEALRRDGDVRFDDPGLEDEEEGLTGGERVVSGPEQLRGSRAAGRQDHSAGERVRARGYGGAVDAVDATRDDVDVDGGMLGRTEALGERAQAEDPGAGPAIQVVPHPGDPD